MPAFPNIPGTCLVLLCMSGGHTRQPCDSVLSGVQEKNTTTASLLYTRLCVALTRMPPCTGWHGCLREGRTHSTWPGGLWGLPAKTLVSGREFVGVVRIGICYPWTKNVMESCRVGRKGKTCHEPSGLFLHEHELWLCSESYCFCFSFGNALSRSFRISKYKMIFWLALQPNVKVLIG